ncbi:MAG: hypothetical protein U5N86_07880 [Planctomycetota bacterium]|nr:hypothetical protein [Planctomycetota bacterium]
MLSITLGITAFEVSNWLLSIEVGTLFIEPGKPRRTGSPNLPQPFEGRVPNMEIFYGLGEQAEEACR